MQLTIYRGTKEIGGNCVELRTESTRLIIDVGMPLVDANREPFDSRSARRKSAEQLLDEGVIPRVPGLFEEGETPDAILLSHAHADHTGLLEYTGSKIPVYLSKGTSKMMLAGSIFAGQPGVERNRSKVFEPEKPFQIGDLTITAHPVDHSAFDSMAFIIEADGKRLLYSGDLRLHGRKPWMEKRLVAAAKERPIDVMLMEGTHFGRGHEEPVTEQELEQQVVEHIKKMDSIALATFSPMHVDRLVTFYRAALRTGRKFIVDPYAAFVMHLVSGQCKIPRPEKEAGIQVYFNQYFADGWERRGLKKIHDLFSGNQITMDEIRKSPEKYVMVFRPTMLPRDFGDQLPPASQCLYSYWPGYLNRPEWDDLKQKLNAVDGEFIEAHTSGHIFAKDIVEFVRAVAPKTVVPIHTFEPERFSEIHPEVRMLNDGQTTSL